MTGAVAPGTETRDWRKKEGEGQAFSRADSADISVLAPYRSQGLGSALVTSALRAALHPTTPPPPTPPSTGVATRAALTPAKPRQPINRALVHVQVGNDEARKFYERLGFKESGV